MVVVVVGIGRIVGHAEEPRSACCHCCSHPKLSPLKDSNSVWVGLVNGFQLSSCWESLAVVVVRDGTTRATRSAIQRFPSSTRCDTFLCGLALVVMDQIWNMGMVGHISRFRALP